MFFNWKERKKMAWEREGRERWRCKQGDSFPVGGQECPFVLQSQLGHCDITLSSLWYQILWNCYTFLFSLLDLIIYQTLWGNSQAPSVAAGKDEWGTSVSFIRRATLVSKSRLTFNFPLLIGNCELLWVLF